MREAGNKAINAIVSNANVLVVDDSGSIRGIEVGLLRELGFNLVHAVVNGAKAWDYLQTHPVDFVVCDWDMPELTGIQLLGKMKNDERFSQIPFLMITASADQQRVMKAIQQGVSDYIIKPFQPKDFVYRVIKMVKKIKPKNRRRA